MSSASQVPIASGREPKGWLDVLGLTQMWASLAIVAMWLAVLFDAVFGPDIVSVSAGGDSTRIPSAVAVALFAFLGSGAVARYGLRDLDGR